MFEKDLERAIERGDVGYVCRIYLIRAMIRFMVLIFISVAVLILIAWILDVTMGIK